MPNQIDQTQQTILDVRTLPLARHVDELVDDYPYNDHHIRRKPG